MPRLYERNCNTCGKPYRKQNRLYCSRSCRPQPVKFINSIRFGGRKHTKETLLKKSDVQRGPLGSNWRGGVNPINKGIRSSSRYKEWRKSVFVRDNYTCQKCGRIGGELNADHIMPFAEYPELRFELSNGRTLCKNPCHRETETYGVRKIKNNNHING